MIAEVITVTNTLTSLKALIETARSAGGTPFSFSVTKCSKVKLKNPADTGVINLADASTVTPVVIINAPEGLFTASIEMFDFSQILLKTGSGTVAIEVVIEQPRI